MAEIDHQLVKFEAAANQLEAEAMMYEDQIDAILVRCNAIAEALLKTTRKDLTDPGTPVFASSTSLN